MKKRLAAATMAVFLMMISTAAAAAAEQPVTKEYIFETTDTNFDYTENQIIEIDGKKYEAKDIDYEVISEVKRVDEIREYSNLTVKSVPETVTADDGTELTLEDIEYVPQTVTDVQVYRDYVNPPDIPEKIQFTVNGKTVTGFRKNTDRQLSDTYNVPFSINGKFYGDEDSMYYVLNGKNIPAETAPEFDQYPDELLAYLGLDPDIYRVDSGQWASGYYQAGDETVRMATYNGMQKSNTYTVTYDGTMYAATAIYSNGIDNTDPIYTVKALVEYVGYEESGLNTLQKVLLTIGVAVIAAGVIVAILFILKKRKSEH